MMIRTDEIHAQFCEEISSGKSLRQTCADNGWAPNFFTEWHREDTAAATRYARACENRADVLMEDMITLADSAREETVMGMDGEDMPTKGIDPARVQAIRLAVETRKWAASKMNRIKYGDTASVNVGMAISVVAPIEIKLPESFVERRLE